MEVREVTVEYRKLVSDGAYGNEGLAVSYTATLGPDDSELTEAHELAAAAYEVVLSRLKRSQNETVREGAETRQEREARWARERREREEA
jgi:hypothetical protein